MVKDIPHFMVDRKQRQGRDRCLGTTFQLRHIHSHLLPWRLCPLKFLEYPQIVVTSWGPRGQHRACGGTVHVQILPVTVSWALLCFAYTFFPALNSEVVLTFLCHIVESTQHMEFSDWLLSVGEIHCGSHYAVSQPDSSFLSTMDWYSGVCLSIPVQEIILIVSRLWQLWIKHKCINFCLGINIQFLWVSSQEQECCVAWKEYAGFWKNCLPKVRHH